ncbi:hypothetical protein Vadar_010125 [Vaccinium darrowii]|uniref:Uncharacterized protein n=1 Tax=Vaccinium darrowii TaxID=229202 RepID=A0ACB7YLQ7_9ERIC|nr:hypothetical protein Vadar_010125 [Vaccinium darrowii]
MCYSDFLERERERETDDLEKNDDRTIGEDDLVEEDDRSSHRSNRRDSRSQNSLLQRAKKVAVIQKKKGASFLNQQFHKNPNPLCSDSDREREHQKGFTRVMGLSPSKRVSQTFTNSPDFNSSCNSVYQECLTLTQHAFPGVLPHQLPHAAFLLHHSLSSTHPLLKRWAPSPPTRSRVNRAYRTIITRHRSRSRTVSDEEEEEEPCLGPAEFEEFAFEVFTGDVMDSVRAAVMRRVPIGVVGIVEVGAGVRAGKDVVGTVIGVYSIGVAASVYLSLFAG